MSNRDKALRTDPLILRLAVRAVHQARKAIRRSNWVVVMDTFIVGSNAAHEICERAGIDPDAFDVDPLYRPDETTRIVWYDHCHHRG